MHYKWLYQCLGGPIELSDPIPAFFACGVHSPAPHDRPAYIDFLRLLVPAIKGNKWLCKYTEPAHISA